MASNAFVVHQLLTRLRDGTLAGVAFSKIVLVGHSFGSGVAMYTQNAYGDADGVVVTGFLHSYGYGLLFNAISMWPVALDPQFIGRNIPADYLTTRPDRRVTFYYEPGADPAVIAADNATKETMTTTEATTTADGQSASTGVHVPVIIVMGNFDTSFCNTPCGDPGSALEGEAAQFPPEAELETYVLANSGHDINLHFTAPTWFAVGREWFDRRFGP